MTYNQAVKEALEKKPALKRRHNEANEQIKSLMEKIRDEKAIIERIEREALDEVICVK